MQDYVMHDQPAITHTASFPYPHGIYRSLLRLPLLFYRLGLGWLMDINQVMVLTTLGRVSGQPRHTPIEYRVHGSKLYVVSAWGQQPNWYQNLLAEPRVTLQCGGRIISAQAQVVENTGEALRVLHLFRKRAPLIYDALISRLTEQDITTRTLPDVSSQFTIVRFDPLPGLPLLPPLAADWRRLPLLAALLLGLLWLWLRRK